MVGSFGHASCRINAESCVHHCITSEINVLSLRRKSWSSIFVTGISISCNTTPFVSDGLCVHFWSKFELGTHCFCVFSLSIRSHKSCRRSRSALAWRRFSDVHSLATLSACIATSASSSAAIMASVFNASVQLLSAPKRSAAMSFSCSKWS